MVARIFHADMISSGPDSIQRDETQESESEREGYPATPTKNKVWYLVYLIKGRGVITQNATWLKVTGGSNEEMRHILNGTQWPRCCNTL